MKPVVILQHQEMVPAGIITEELRDLGCEWATIDVAGGEPVPKMTGAAALVVLGGTMNVDELERYPYLRAGRVAMEQAIASEIPVVGICLGAQMLARTLGAEVTRCSPRNAGFGPLVATEDGQLDPIFGGFAEGAPVLQFHEDTFALPEGATSLFTGEGETHQGFRWGRSAYGIQFHFEITQQQIVDWCTAIGADRMVSEWGTTLPELLNQAEEHLAAQQTAGRVAVQRLVGAITGYGQGPSA